MRSLVLLVALLGVHVGAEAQKPTVEPTPPMSRVPCNLSYWSIDWDFSVGPQGFLPAECDAGGTPVWEHGAAVGIPDAPARVWGTAVAGNYPNDAGDGLRSPGFHVDDAHRYVEVHHYFETEYEYDGANMVVRPDVAPWEPMGGYTVPQISPSGAYYAWCVDGEPGWTGSSGGWRWDCFDLSEYQGMDVFLEFDFGSDVSVTAPGWYLARVIVGGVLQQGACCDPQTGECHVTTEHGCLEAGGVWHPESPSCDPNPCAVPPAPANLVALTRGPERIRLEWEHGAGGADEFIIERKEGPQEPWEEVNVVPGEQTVWEDTSVGTGPTYYYRVRASNSQGDSEVSNFANAVCGVIPLAPSNFVATASSTIQIDLDWTDNSINEVGFEIERKEGEFGAWDFNAFRAARQPANATSTWDPMVEPETDYTYRIRSYNHFGHSDWVVSNLCTTLEDPGAFTSTIVVRRGAQTVEGAKVETRADADSVWTYVGLTDQSGVLVVEGLHVGDRLRASTEEQITWDCRKTNGEGTGPFGVWLRRDSDVTDTNGNMHPFRIQDVEVSYTLELHHDVFRFDLTFTTEWDIPHEDAYWDSLVIGCQATSDYLFDVMDGQAALGKVRIWDNKVWWNEAHVRIYSANIGAKARVNDYYDCDWESPEDHTHMYPHGPRHWGWWTTLVHELGHYVLDLKDEYINGLGMKVMGSLHTQFPSLYPKRFGFMQSHPVEAEMSSQNDYPFNYDYGVPWNQRMYHETKQLYTRGHSCWDHVAGKLEGMASDVDIMLPQPGWFLGVSSSPDRDGPQAEEFTVPVVLVDSATRQAPLVDVDIIDSGPGSYESAITITTEGGVAPGADVYRFTDDDWAYLGRANARGQVWARGLRPEDAIRAYHRDADGVRVANHTLHADVPPTLNLRMSPENGTSRAMGLRRRDAAAPGAVVRAVPLGGPPITTVELRCRADEPLGALPEVFCYHSGSGGALPVSEDPSGYYRAQVELDLSDSLFSGQGLFEITLRDTSENATTFVAPFEIDVAEAGEDFETYQRSTQFTLLEDNVQSDQTFVTISANCVPYRCEEPLGHPVTDVFSLTMAEDNVWPHGGSVNIAYDDSLLAGLDETSLVLARFDFPTRQWVLADSGRVVPEQNATTAMMTGSGVFCVFASAVSTDEVPPGRVEDLGGVPTSGVGDVELLWTAPSEDDTGGGPVQEYIVAYSENPFVEDDWTTLRKLKVGSIPRAPGSDEWSVIRLPEPGRLYYLGLRAKDEASNLSPLSNVAYTIAGIADPNLVPLPATGFRAVDEPDDEGEAARLWWQRSYDDGGGKNTVVAYKLYRNNPPSAFPESLAVVPAGTTTYVDVTVQNDNTYQYWVSASDGEIETMTRENRALPARNLGVPIADFTSDGSVGVNDLSHLADTYGILSDDPEFDPLFDLDADDQIWEGDAAILGELFGGPPDTDPPGQNGEAGVFVRYVPDEGELWHLDLSVTAVSNLAGFQVGVHYPSAEATFIGATGEVVHGEPPLLNRNRGLTPIFVVQNSQPDLVRVATAIQDASELLAPEGDGYLCRMSFSGPGMESTSVLRVHLMDQEKRINRHTDIIVTTPDAATVLRPHLYSSYPNPCQIAAAMRFQIPQRGRVTLRIFDVSGRVVRTLVDDHYDAGVHGVAWDIRNDARREVASGMYFYRLETDGYTMARKLLVIR